MKITKIATGWQSPNVSTSLCCSKCKCKLGGSEKFCPQCGRELKPKPHLIPSKSVIDILNKTLEAQ